jgi:hypothetical protein
VVVFFTVFNIIYRDSASEIQVSSGKSLTVGKSHAKNMKDKEEMASMLHQDVSTFSA